VGLKDMQIPENVRKCERPIDSDRRESTENIKTRLFAYDRTGTEGRGCMDWFTGF